MDGENIVTFCLNHDLFYCFNFLLFHIHHINLSNHGSDLGFITILVGKNTNHRQVIFKLLPLRQAQGGNNFLCHGELVESRHY